VQATLPGDSAIAIPVGLISITLPVIAKPDTNKNPAAKNAIKANAMLIFKNLFIFHPPLKLNDMYVINTIISVFDEASLYLFR
jgi:hypothetical protein